MLIKLPNGDWVAPCKITAISHKEGTICVLTTNTNQLGTMGAYWESETPQEDSDELAETVNRALYKEG